MRQFLMALCGLILLASPLMAQVDPAVASKPDDQLTKDEAEARINEFSGKVNALKSRADALTAQNDDLTKQMASLAEDTRKCNAEMYALVGATEADVRNFRERLGRTDGRIRELAALTDDQLNAAKAEVDGMEKTMDSIRGQKIAILPEFYQKVVDMGTRVKALRTRLNGLTKYYTVGTWKETKDCLWNIAGRDQTYNDPFMWPKIWQANTDKIRNPDVIYPGQVLTVPANNQKTDEDMRAERLYFRNKKLGRRYTREQPYEGQGAGSGGR